MISFLQTKVQAPSRRQRGVFIVAAVACAVQNHERTPDLGYFWQLADISYSISATYLPSCLFNLHKISRPKNDKNGPPRPQKNHPHPPSPSPVPVALQVPSGRWPHHRISNVWRWLQQILDLERR